MRYVALHALIFLLAAAAGVAVGVPGMVERAGERVVSRLEDALDVDIEVGAVAWTFGGDVTLSDLSVRPRGAPAGEAPLLAAKAIRVEAEVRMLAQEVELRRVEVDDPALFVTRRADGSDNLRRVVEGARAILEPSGAGEGPRGAASGGLSRLLVHRIPEVLATGASVVVDAPGVTLPAMLRAPSRVALRDGTVVIKNTSLVREDDNLTLSADFADSSWDPGYGVTLQTVVRLAGGPIPATVAFERPARLAVGSRVLSVGGVHWDGHTDAPIEVDQVALSVPLTEQARRSGEPIDPAITVKSAQILLGPEVTLASLRELAGASDRAEAVRGLLGRIRRIELMHPAVVFERTPDGHNFSDLTGTPVEVDEEELEDGPDKALGVLMEAAKAASQRLGPGAGKCRGGCEGRGFRDFLVRGFGRLERGVTQVSEGAIATARRVPFQHLVVRGGHFVWRDVTPVGDGAPRLSERLENFELDAKREGELLAFRTSFVMPGSGRRQNVVSGKVHLVTGDSQLQARIGRLKLHPYRHIFPKSLPVAPDMLLVDTDLTMVWSPASDVARIEGKLGLANAAFRYPALATAPLSGLDVALDFNAQLDRARKTFVLGQSDVTLGKTHTRVRADVASYDTVPKLSGALRVERTRCQDVADSLPTELLPMLEGLRVDGTLAWHLDMSLDTADMETLTYHSFPELNGFRVTDMGSQLNLDAVRGTFYHRIEEADGTRREMLLGPGSPQWTSLDDISEYMVKGVTTTEDGAFFRHQGFSSFAIRQSLVTNLKKGSFVRGASTISQQLVKNLFLSREKTISRKLQEMFITWQMENALSKERIMELYLNIIEWGPGIYGVTQAARHYFGKRPAELSALEAVFLVSLIPSPKRYYHQFERGEVTDGWRRHLRWIMGVMVERGKLSQAEYEAAWPYSPVFRGRTAGVAPVEDATPTSAAPTPTPTP